MLQRISIVGLEKVERQITKTGASYLPDHRLPIYHISTGTRMHSYNVRIIGILKGNAHQYIWPTLNVIDMPEISRFFGIIIRMYFGDHNPPHFHAIYQEETAEYDIQTLEVIRGKLSTRAHSLVLEWASEHRAELMEDWLLASELKEMKPIEPLR